MSMVVSQVMDENLKHTLQFGVGLHHAGLNDRDRSLVEELFTNTKIQVIVFQLLSFGLHFPLLLRVQQMTCFLTCYDLHGFVNPQLQWEMYKFLSCS